MDPIGWLLIVSALFVAAAAGTAYALVSARRARPEAPSEPHPSEDFRALVARVEQLELERPRFVNEMNGMLDQCDELLDRVRKRKASLDGARAHAPHDGPHSTQPELPDIGDELDARRRGKAEVARRFGGG